MSIYESALEDIKTDIQGNIDNLNNFANQANNATDKGTYDNFVEKYNSEKALYDTNKIAYDNAVVDYERYQTVNKVSSILVDVPNMKDKYQHMAGGFFGMYGAMPGGPMWSPVTTANMEVGRPSISPMANLLNGNILSFLNYGYGGITRLLMGGQLDLMFNTRIRETTVYRVKISIEVNGKTTTEERDISVGGDAEGNAMANLGEQDMSLDELKDMMNLEFTGLENTIANITQFSPIGQFPMASGIVVAIYNTATGEAYRAEQVLGRTLVDTTLGAFSNRLTQGIVTKFGVTSIPAVLGLSLAVNAVMYEAFQVAVGLDRSFGLGGDYIGTNAEGTRMYEGNYSARDTMEYMKAATGFLDYAINIGVVDESGADLGYGVYNYGGFGYSGSFVSDPTGGMYGTYTQDNVGLFTGDTVTTVYEDGTYTIEDTSDISDRSASYDPVSGWNVSPNALGGYNTINTYTGEQYVTDKNGDLVDDDDSWGDLEDSIESEYV